MRARAWAFAAGMLVALVGFMGPAVAQDADLGRVRLGGLPGEEPGIPRQQQASSPFVPGSSSGFPDAEAPGFAVSERVGPGPSTPDAGAEPPQASPPGPSEQADRAPVPEAREPPPEAAGAEARAAQARQAAEAQAAERGRASMAAPSVAVGQPLRAEPPPAPLPAMGRVTLPELPGARLDLPGPEGPAGAPGHVAGVPAGSEGGGARTEPGWDAGARLPARWALGDQPGGSGPGAAPPHGPEAAGAGPAGDPGIVAGAALPMAVAGAAAALLAPAWALYRRIARGRALEHPHRAAILAAVRERPGLTPGELRTATGLHYTTCVHHLRVLDGLGFLVMRRVGGQWRCFPADAGGRGTLAAAAGPTARALLALVAERPGISPAEAARALGLARSSVQHHTDRLQALGLLEARREGQRVRLRLPAGERMDRGGAPAA